MNDENWFTPKQMIKGAGINRDLYNQWLYKGIITATREADGAGTQSEYSLDDICRVSIIRYLKKAGIRLKHASSMASNIINLYKENSLKKDFKSGASSYEIFVAANDISKVEITRSNKKESPVSILVDVGAIKLKVMKKLKL